MYAKKKNGPWLRRYLDLKTVVAINIGLIALVGWGVYRERANSSEVEARYRSLETEVNSLETQNNEYAALMGKMGTPGFIEHEARMKLSYQKPGEQILVLRQADQAEVAVPDVSPAVQNLSNPQKWWNYFFGNR